MDKLQGRLRDVGETTNRTGAHEIYPHDHSRSALQCAAVSVCEDIRSGSTYMKGRKLAGKMGICTSLNGDCMHRTNG